MNKKNQLFFNTSVPFNASVLPASGLMKYQRRHFANIDYGMIPRLFSQPTLIKLMDPSRAYVNNFTAADRKYETTGRSFAHEDFLRCHDWTYPVQKGCFAQAQYLPCRIAGYTAYRDVGQDVREITALFGIDFEAPPVSDAVEPSIDRDVKV